MAEQHNQYDLGEDDIISLFAELASDDPENALVIATGILTGVAEHFTRFKGGNPDNEIFLHGDGVMRNITVHKRATPAQPAEGEV